MVIEITLLGPPRVTRAGATVVFETRKAMALLAHLALSNRPRPRASLCELLYPGYDLEHARGALRRTLSTLRKGIGEEWIETTGDGVALRTGAGLKLDVAEFRSLASDPTTEVRLREAVALFAGAFLEGFSLRDSPDFDDWQVATADALAAELSSALRRLVERLAVCGEFEEATLCARRWLALDPLHEPAHRELIQLHAWSGNRAAALEQYRTCVRTLSRELGVAPLEETAALYAQVNEGRLAPPARHEARSTTPVPAAAPPDELPLVGRADDLAMLLDAHRTARPDGALAVIEGEAGIGKTRLAAEILRRARATGAVVLEARCHEDEAGLPYGPVVDLLRQAQRTAQLGWHEGVPAQRLADAGLLLPDLAELGAGGTEVLPLGGPGAQVRLMEGIAAVIGAACAGPRPGVVLVDDVHAADDATLDAIAYLGRRLSDRPLLLILCWRTERVPPGHRLRRLAVDLARDSRATVVRPGRLSNADVAGLMVSVIPAATTPDLEQRVYLESEGLPLYVAECLAGLVPGPDGPIKVRSPQARGLLDGRVAALGETARQVLGAAATIGRSFDLDTLRRTSGRSSEETVGALEELVTHGLVREGAGDAYDFAHQKLREGVYEQTALARRQLLHARVAAALSGNRAGAERPALVAQHLRLAGDRAGAADQYRLAAEHAASLYAPVDALEHLQAALALGYPDVVSLQERIGDLRTVLGDYGGALAAYETAAADCTSPAARAPIEHKLGGVHHRRGEWERAESHLRAAIDATTDDQAGLAARIQADLGLTLLNVGDTGRATELAGDALTLAEAAHDRQASAQAHNLLGVLARREGSTEAALEHLERSLALARELGDVPAEVAALNNLALLQRDEQVLPAALELTERALALCSRYGDRHREAALENNLADLHHAAGDETESMAHLKRAVTIFREVGADEAARLPEIWKLVSW